MRTANRRVEPATVPTQKMTSVCQGTPNGAATLPLFCANPESSTRRFPGPCASSRHIHMPTEIAPVLHPEVTIYDQITARGVSRREFLGFCAWMGACIGVQASGVDRIVKALETKKRIPVIWLHF